MLAVVTGGPAETFTAGGGTPAAAAQFASNEAS